MIYKWRPGSHVRGNAQAVGERLTELSRGNKQRLTPKLVLADARRKDSPLHASFDWDDRAAAEKWRLKQASHMIGCIVSIVPESGGKKRPFRAFLNVQEAKGSSYCPTRVVMSSKELREQAVAAAWQELVEWRDRYSAYKELAHVFSVIDRNTRNALRKAA